MFVEIKTPDDRRKYGSALMELQFCRLSDGTPVEKIVAVDSITHWKSDSLYVADENEFCLKYGDIFDCGIYNNLQTGTVDPYGINYYPRGLIEVILQRVLERNPEDCEALAEWLVRAGEYNGFYILGI